MTRSKSTKKAANATANAGPSSPTSPASAELQTSTDDEDDSGSVLTPNMLTKALKSLQDSVFSKIESANQDLHTEIKSVRHELVTSIAGLQTALTTHEGRLGELERSATFTGDRVTELQTTVDRLREEVLVLQTRAEDAESRSRRQNLRLVGVREGLEKGKPTEFVSGLLKDLFQLPEAPLLDRAHRSLRPKPAPGDPPRMFIMKVHYTKVRDDMLRKAAEGPLSYDGMNLSLWPDYTDAVRKKRKAFGDVRDKVKTIEGATAKLFFPATLRVVLPGQNERSFTDASQAMSFVSRYSPRPPTPPRTSPTSAPQHTEGTD